MLYPACRIKVVNARLFFSGPRPLKVWAVLAQKTLTRRKVEGAISSHLLSRIGEPS
jgi:hypothetical protein